MKPKIFKSDVDQFLRVLNSIENQPAFIIETIDYLNQIETIKEIIPATKTFLMCTDKKPKMTKIYKVFEIFGETMIIHKKGTLWQCSHYGTGLSVIRGSKYSTAAQTMETATERIKSVGEDKFKELINKSVIINKEPITTAR